VLGVATGIMFAVHPVHTEAVAWISGRSELMSAAAGMSAWWFHLRVRDSGRRWPAVAAAILLVAALESKETAACWPFVFVVADWIFPPRRSTTGAASKSRGVTAMLYAAYGVILLLWLGQRYAVLGQLRKSPGEGEHLLNPLEGEPWWPARPFTFLRVLALAVGKSFPSVSSCIDYGYNQVPLARGPMHIDVIAAAAGLGGLLAWGWRVVKRGDAGVGKGALLLAAAAFLLAWLPASSILLPSVSIFAERNLYLPSLGWCLFAGVLAAWVWRRSGRHRRRLLYAGIVVVAVMGAVTMERSVNFSGSVPLFGATASNCPASARGHFLHGTALHDAAEFEQAAGAFRRALAIAPRHTDARAHLSLSLAHAGRGEEAAREAREALAARPRVTETRLAVIDALVRAGLADEASRAMQELRQERPDDIGVLFASAQELRAEGKLDEAIDLFRRIEARFPDNPVGPDGLGAVHMQRGEDGLARRALELALELDPYDTNALYNLGLIALRSQPPTQALAGEAAARFRRYLRMLPEDAVIWMRLGQALGRLGAHSEAEAAYRRAVAIAPGQPALRRALDAFLAGNEHE